MSLYRVFGCVAGFNIDQEVEAENGAEAILTVAGDYRPVFKRADWKKSVNAWYRDHVRLNATQIQPELSFVVVRVIDCTRHYAASDVDWKPYMDRHTIRFLSSTKAQEFISDYCVGENAHVGVVPYPVNVRV